MRAIPRADTSTPLESIRWAMFLAYRTQKLATYRDAKRLHKGEADHEGFDAALNLLRDTGEARTFKVAVAKRGRQSLYLHPTYEYEIAFDPHTETFRAAPTTTLVPLAEPYRTLAEVDPPAPGQEPSDAHPVVAGRPRPGTATPAERHRQPPEPDPEPEAEKKPEPKAHAPTPDSPTPEPVPAQKELSRENAYEVMRGLITRSMSERKSMGVTKSELIRGLMQEGYPEVDASDFYKGLTGQRAEAFLEGGLVQSLPGSINNKTEVPRYFIRTAGQAMDRDRAEFEVQKRQHLSQTLRTQR